MGLPAACQLAIRCTPLAERNCGPMYALRRGTCPAHWARAPGRCTLYGAERARGKKSTARISWRVKEDPGRQREGPSWPLPSLPMASGDESLEPSSAPGYVCPLDRAPQLLALSPERSCSAGEKLGGDADNGCKSFCSLPQIPSALPPTGR